MGGRQAGSHLSSFHLNTDAPSEPGPDGTCPEWRGGGGDQGGGGRGEGGESRLEELLRLQKQMKQISAAVKAFRCNQSLIIG